MTAPKKSGMWSVTSYANASTISGLMLETQVQGKKVLVPFAELVAAVSQATGNVPLPEEPGTYIMNVTISDAGVPSYSWEAASPLEFSDN